MRVTIAILSLVLCSGGAFAQTSPDPKATKGSQHSTGTTVLPPEVKTDTPPQGGDTGPKDTGTGGAPAESPQGQTPPSMQPAPQGSSETIVGPK
jgi:hypothetical protein